MSEVNLSTDETRVSYGIGRQLGDQLRDNPPPGVSLDAILADKYVNYDWLKSDAGKNYEFKGEPVLESDEIGIAVRKGDPLRDKLNAALKEIIADGTYKKINDKYFPFSIY